MLDNGIGITLGDEKPEKEEKEDLSLPFLLNSSC